MLRLNRHSDSASRDFDAGEAGVVRPVQACQGLSLVPSDLQRCPAEAGTHVVLGQQGELGLEAPVDVRRAPAQLPDIDEIGRALE